MTLTRCSSGPDPSRYLCRVPDLGPTFQQSGQQAGHVRCGKADAVEVALARNAQHEDHRIRQEGSATAIRWRSPAERVAPRSPTRVPSRRTRASGSRSACHPGPSGKGIDRASRPAQTTVFPPPG